MRTAAAVRRELRGTLVVFAVQLGLLVALGAASWWYGLATLRGARAQERVAHEEMHRAQASLSELAGAIERLEPTSEAWQTGAALDELKRVAADVEAVLRAHGTPDQAADGEAMLSRLAASAADVLAATEPGARAAAGRRFGELVELVERRLRSAEVAALEHAGSAGDRCIRALLALCAISVVVYVGTMLWLRERLLSTFKGQYAETKRSAAAFAAQLEASVRGAPAAPAEAAPGMEPLAGAVDATRAALDRTRDTLRFERERARFSHDLVEALDLAEQEPEVCATVARAAQVVFPGAAFQLLLADNSHAQLTQQLPDGKVRCTPDSPHGCPALRRSRTVVHHPDGGMGRCLRLPAARETVACASISVRGRAVGVAQLAAGAIDAAAVETLTAMSFSIGARLGVVRTLGERELAAATDVLTGLANRRAMNDRIAQLDQRGLPYAVVSADLDHFKRLNDTYGHEVGDRCLRIFAQALRDACRGDDLACRPGGEEFALVLAGTDAAGAASVAARIHALLAEGSRRAGLPFTVSLGIAARPAHGDCAEEVLRAADTALYAAKDAGRNCTRVFAVATVAALPPAPPAGEGLSPAA